METPTLEAFKTWAKEHQSLALTVCKAQAFVECERERVSTYIRPIFDRYNFQATLGGNGERITDPEKLYLCEDEELTTAYYAECDRAHRKHGFKGPEGHCQVLTAEDMHRRAAAALIEAGMKLFDLGTADIYGENRTKMLTLLLGACLVKEKKAA